MGVFAGIILLVFGLIWLHVHNKVMSEIESPRRSVSAVESSANQLPVFKMEETVHVGYMTYAVWRAWSSNSLREDNKYLDDLPNASYLFIELTVRNNDKEARKIPPFKLIDENNAEYQVSSR